MATSVSRGANTRMGTCPHGLPMGACPICNGMGGGGSSVKKDTKPREMTWNECYAVGQMLKAQKLAHKQTLQMFAIQDLAAHLNKIQEQVNSFKLAIMNSSLPKPLAKVISVLTDAVVTTAIKTIQTVVNTVQNIAKAVTEMVDNIKQKIAGVMDKLTAVFGELKAAVQKKISEKFKEVKKKIFNLFGLAGADNEDDDESKKVEEEKRIFDLNTAKEALFEIKENKNTIQEDEKEKI